MAFISGNRSNECKYIYELPYTERKLLCNILDINDQWEKLGGEKMGFSVLELNEIKRAEKCGESPSDRLLQIWGRKNNTILHLYYLLYSLEHFQAMSVLLPFIPEKYHYKKLHSDIPTSEASAAKEKKDTPLVFPNPDPSLLTDLRIKNGNGGSMSAGRNPSSGSFSSNEFNGNSNLMPPKSIQNPKVPEHLLNTQGIASSIARTQAETIPSSKPSEGGSPFSGKILNTPFSKRDEISLMNAIPIQVENGNGENAYPGVMSKSQNGSDGLRDPPVLLKDLPPVLNLEGGLSRKRHQSNCSDFSNLSECGVPMIPYSELEESTGVWNKQNLLGSGGFGSVYKGTWINVNVAIKKINASSEKENESSNLIQINQLMEELRFLQKYRHDNILQVYGFSADEGKPHCLVYQFMANGSLEYRLQCRKIKAFSESSSPAPLTWLQRFSVAKGTAAALQFLHTVQEKPLIHGDVKSANILLDGFLQPKLGDFGLAREGPQSELTSMKVSHVHGTRPYIPEEYLRSKKLSVKVDAYSYGIVLFEMCSGRRAYDEKTRKYLKEEVLEATDRSSLQDPKGGTELSAVFDILFQIGHSCIQRLPKKRPDMTSIFHDLEKFENILKETERNRKTSLDDYPPCGVHSCHTPTYPLTLPSCSTSPLNFPPNQSSFIHPHIAVSPHLRPHYTPPHTFRPPHVSFPMPPPPPASPGGHHPITWSPLWVKGGIAGGASQEAVQGHHHHHHHQQVPPSTGTPHHRVRSDHPGVVSHPQQESPVYPDLTEEPEPQNLPMIPDISRLILKSSTEVFQRSSSLSSTSSSASSSASSDDDPEPPSPGEAFTQIPPKLNELSLHGNASSSSQTKNVSAEGKKSFFD